MFSRSKLARAVLAAGLCGAATLSFAAPMGDGDASTGRPHPASKSSHSFDQAQSGSLRGASHGVAYGEGPAAVHASSHGHRMAAAGSVKASVPHRR